MSDYTKVGNRYYKVDTVEEVETIIKATYNEEEDEYKVCGEWSVEDFLAHETTFDGNTEDEYANIKKDLKLK